MSIPIQRGPASRTTMPEDERVIVGESVRVNHQKRRACRRFLVRRHTSAWCRLFPNTPAWIVWDRETDRLTAHATWSGALRYIRAYLVATTSSHNRLHETHTPHHYVPGDGWTPIEEPSA